MQNADRPTFIEMIEQTARLYGKKLELEVLGLYWEDLRDFEFLDVKDALRMHRQDPKAGKFMPKPADLIQQLRGEGKQKAVQMQSDLRCAADHHGKRCPMVGTMSESTTAGGQWFCRAHWQTRHDPKLAQTVLEDLLKNPPKQDPSLTQLVDEIVEIERAECKERGITPKQLFNERMRELFGKIILSD